MAALRVWNHTIKKVGGVAEMGCPQYAGYTIQEVISQKLISIVLKHILYVFHPFRK